MNTSRTSTTVVRVGFFIITLTFVNALLPSAGASDTTRKPLPENYDSLIVAKRWNNLSACKKIIAYQAVQTTPLPHFPPGLLSLIMSYLTEASRSFTIRANDILEKNPYKRDFLGNCSQPILYIRPTIENGNALSLESWLEIFWRSEANNHCLFHGKTFLIRITDFNGAEIQDKEKIIVCTEFKRGDNKQCSLSDTSCKSSKKAPGHYHTIALQAILKTEMEITDYPSDYGVEQAESDALEVTRDEGKSLDVRIADFDPESQGGNIIEGYIYDRKEDEMIIAIMHACSHPLANDACAALEKEAQEESKKVRFV